jgi:glycosyltransferase involved in cell wall biosynthesis
MKILLVHNYYRRGNPGGEDVVYEQEKSLLSQSGHSIATYTRSNDELNESYFVDQWSAFSQLVNPARSKRELLALVRSFRPDVVHAHNLFPLIGTAFFDVAQESGTPLVLTMHNYRLSCIAATHYRGGQVCQKCKLPGAWAGIRHACYRKSRVASAAVALATQRWGQAIRSAKGPMAVIALSDFAAEQLLDAGIPASRIFVKPNFVDVARPESIGMSTTLKDSLPYVVFSGRLSEEKGIVDLIHAWRNMRSIKLKVLGDGPLRSALERLVVEEALDVEILGTRQRREALNIVAGALCQVVPSRWFEGMPLVVLEAWSLGVPVIGSRLGGLAEMLGRDERGLTFDPGDSAQIAKLVHRISADPALRRRLKAAGAEATLAHSREKSLQILTSVYRSVLRV